MRTPSAPPAAPAPDTPAPAAPEPSPHEAVVVAPAEPVPPPPAPTTIVLGDDSTPVVAAPEPEWDGKTARGVQDAAYVIKRAVDALGGPNGVESHRRFTAHITLESPFLLRGKLLFDWSKGIVLQLDAMPSQLFWSSKDTCQILYGPRRVPLPCGREQRILGKVLWNTAKYWAGHWEGFGPVQSASSYNNPLLNLAVNGLATGSMGLFAEFSIESGELVQLQVPSEEGGSRTQFSRVSRIADNWNATTEWRLLPSSSGTESPDAQNAEAAQALILIRKVDLGVDPSVFAVPRQDGTTDGLGIVRAEAELQTGGVLLGLTNVRLDTVNDEMHEDPFRYDQWRMALAENVIIVDPAGGAQIAHWVPTDEAVPPALRSAKLPYAPHTGWLTARAQVTSPELLVALAERFRKEAKALGREPVGRVYYRGAQQDHGVKGMVIVGELQLALPAAAP